MVLSIGYPYAEKINELDLYPTFPYKNLLKSIIYSNIKSKEHNISKTEHILISL